MKAKQIMTGPAITVGENDSLRQCAHRMIELGVTGFPVVDGEGTLVGFVSASDFVARKAYVSSSRTEVLELFGQWFNSGEIKKVYDEAGNVSVSEVMSSPVATVGPDESVREVFDRMSEAGVRAVVVVEDGKPLGLVSVTDFLKLMLG